jgi:hypothetical protein
MSTSPDPIFRKLLTDDLAARAVGERLQLESPFDFATVRFLVGGLIDCDRLLSMDITSLGGMAGAW